MRGLSIRQFEVIRTLGAGTFGRVKLVRLAGQPEPFALKVIPKSLVIQLKQVEHIQLEKRILEELEHPFIYSLKAAFQDELMVYMLFEFCSGGELFNRLRKDGRFSNDIALFYSTEILLALTHMHEHSVVYRDLKP
jgi:serine/threonine protein kinase